MPDKQATLYTKLMKQVQEAHTFPLISDHFIILHQQDLTLPST